MLSFETPTLPLKTDSSGTIRVGGTRVRLDTIVYAFNQGYTAEEILSQFPALELADIYAVISYYRLSSISSKTTSTTKKKRIS